MAKTNFPKRNPSNVQQATLCFLVEKEKGEIVKVLLAMKKRGFGKDLWNGLGGKVEEETLKEAVAREVEEEVGIKPRGLVKVGLLHFYFPDDPKKKGWNQDVHVFFATEWKGNPVETDEMRPEWFTVVDIPYKSMWDADALWLPKVLKGKKITAWISFDDNNKTLDCKIEKLKNE